MKKLNNSIVSLAIITFFLISAVMPNSIVLAAGPATVNLLTAGNFVILSKTGITNIPTSIITGNIGTSPITGASIAGLGCGEVTGTIYTVDAAGPACRTVDAGLLTTAISDMEAAYTYAAGATLPDGTELYAGNLGGQTFAPGLYKWSTDVTIPTDVTLSGGANDIWIFQIAGNLDIASGASIPAGIKVILSGGALATNVYWQVGGLTGATLGTYSTFNGTILSAKQVIIQTGAVLNGRALAQTQVTLDNNTVSAPEDAPAPAPVPEVVVVSSGGSSSGGAFMPVYTGYGTDGYGPIPSIAPVAVAPVYVVPVATYTSYTPSFPNTGLSTENKSFPWGIIALVGVVILTAPLLGAVLKKSEDAV